MDSEISNKFGNAVKLMGTKYPSLISFYCLCDKQEIEDCTFRLNTRIGMVPVIEYNPKFINAISLYTMRALLSIEMFRLILHHSTIRVMHPVVTCIKASNIICLNHDILSTRMDPDIIELFPSKSDITKLDPNFDFEKDGFLEKIFAILNKAEQNESHFITIPSESNKTSDNDSDKFTSEKDAIKEHFSKRNQEKCTEGWGENHLIDERIKAEVNKEAKNVKNWSKMPADLRNKILAANKNEYNIMAVLNNFARSVMSDNWRITRNRLSIRFPAELEIPGKVHELKSKVLFAIDTSGSMNEEEIIKGITFMQKTIRNAEVYYCWWDASCTDILRVKEPKPMRPFGGGGTDPQCVLGKIEKEHLKFNGIVFITDCGFSWRKPNKKFPIMILQTDDAVKPPSWIGKMVVPMKKLLLKASKNG